MSEIGQFLAQFWRVFTDVQVPLLGISFSQLWLGVFVVSISIIILRPLLGIGGGIFQNLTGVGRRAVSERRSTSRSEETYQRRRAEREADWQRHFKQMQDAKMKK